MVAQLLILIAGVFACSTAAIFIRISTLHPILVAAYRLLTAALILTPLFLRSLRKHPKAYSRKYLFRSLIAGSLLAGHFISWNIGVRMAQVATASLIVNMVPVVMPLLLFFLVRERLTRKEWIGTVVAIAAVVLLTLSDFEVDRRYFLGDALCFGSMILFGAYLAIARRYKELPSVWLYIVPLYYMAGAVCFAVSLPFVSPTEGCSPKELLLILALALIPTISGHTTLNHAMRHIRGQVVSLMVMGQFIFAGILAYLVFGEIPEFGFYPASAAIVLGAWLAVRGKKRS